MELEIHEISSCCLECRTKFSKGKGWDLIQIQNEELESNQQTHHFCPFPDTSIFTLIWWQVLRVTKGELFQLRIPSTYTEKILSPSFKSIQLGNGKLVTGHKGEISLLTDSQTSQLCSAGEEVKPAPEQAMCIHAEASSGFQRSAFRSLKEQ